MPPAVIAAGVVAAGTIGGAAIASGSQKSAANTAAQAETNAANQNAQLATQFRQQNQGNLQPWLNTGTQANALVNSFLFGPQQQPATNQIAGQTPVDAMPGGRPYNRFSAVPGVQGIDGAGDMAPYYWPSAPAPQSTPQANPVDAYNAFTSSPYYQFPLQEGMRQLNTGLASNGNIFSGDAAKAAIKYGQNYGSGQLMNFLNLAGQQSDRGLQAGSAIAGVGQNALASQSASNMAAGNAAANAALASGTANANMWAATGNALGNLAGTIINPQANPFASSYGSGTGSMALSDRRLKKNIELIRRGADGLGWYRWNWKTDGSAAEGVLADEVKALRPSAYVPNFRDGFDGVNYAELGAI